MTKRYSDNIAKAVSTYLKENDLNYSFDEEAGSFEFGIPLHGKIRSVYYFIIVFKGDYVVHAVSPIGADPKDSRMLQQMAEFFCRVNYSTRCGSFDLDFRDGEIRYKCYVSCEGEAVPTSEIIRESILAPARMFDRYAPGILGIIFHEKNAGEMIEECENDEKEVRELMEELGENGISVRDIFAKAAERLGISMNRDAEGDGNAIAEAVKHLDLSDGDDEHAAEETTSEADEPDAEVLDADVMEALSDLLNRFVDEDEDGDEDESEDEDGDEDGSEDEDGDEDENEAEDESEEIH